MNDLDALDVKRCLNVLDRTAMEDRLAATVATLPLIAGALYFLAYGFGHWWFTAGIVRTVGSITTKADQPPDLPVGCRSPQ